MYNNVYTRNARYATNDSVYITVQNVDAWLLKCISIFKLGWRAAQRSTILAKLGIILLTISCLCVMNI